MDEPKNTHYTVLARRFRPQTFDEVIGQQPVAQALKNAIQAGRVAHAYLFTGARGVGKTSMARILAKALNCPNVKKGVPCNQCEICKGISAGNDVDVLEIDGASNRGIDDIRSLRANVSVKSMRTAYKIYIIDEVHMLTREAFNALLKTLEEPPSNVKFVFCTTEPNKVPDTILSRCQRFDFATIDAQNIMTRLQQIAGMEGYEVNADALELVARRANGSMRDSQSLFDQLLAFGEKKIQAADVHRLLGTADDDRLVELVEALVSRDRAAALQSFQNALDGGVQLAELVDQLLYYLRDLMVQATGAENVPLLSVSSGFRDTLKTQADQWGLQTIVAALQILSEAKSRMFRASFARALAELALIRISLLGDLDQLSRLLQAVEKGAITLYGGNLDISAAPQPVKALSPKADEKSKKKTEPQLKTEPPAPLTAEPAATLPPDFVDFRPGSEKFLLTQVLEKTKGTLKTALENASNIAILGPKHLAITFPSSYHFGKTYCEKAETQSHLVGIVHELTGQSVALSFQLEEETKARETTVASPSSSPSRRLEEPLKDPLVQQAMEIFGATPVKVEEFRTTSESED